MGRCCTRKHQGADLFMWVHEEPLYSLMVQIEGLEPKRGWTQVDPALPLPPPGKTTEFLFIYVEQWPGPLPCIPVGSYAGRWKGLVLLKLEQGRGYWRGQGSVLPGGGEAAGGRGVPDAARRGGRSRSREHA